MYSLILAVAIIIFALGFSYFNGVNGRLSSSQSVFDYHKYLTFDPLVPSNTMGKRLTKLKVEKAINQNEKVLPAYFSATYGNSFSIMEGVPSQLKIHFTEAGTDIKLNGKINAKLYKHDNDSGATIQFKNNGLLFNITSTNNQVSLQQLKKISESVHVKVKKAPDIINLSYIGAKSIKHLSFNPIRAKQMVIPQGYKFDLESSAINVVSGSRNETYQLIFYNKNKSTGYPYITIKQTKSSNQESPQSNNDDKVQKIDGVLAYTHQGNPKIPAAQFKEPQSNIYVTIYASLPSNELKQLIHAILTSSK